MFRPPTVRHRLVTPLFFAKSSTFASTSVCAVADFPQSDTVSQILGHFNSFPLPYSPKLLFSSLRKNIWFKNEVLKLRPSEIDTIIEKLDPENAIGFFFLLQNQFGVKHTRNLQFVIAHILAEKKRFRALRCHLQRVLQDEGCGSAPSFCELLFKSFKGWDSNHVVWDMLAFVYCRAGMVHDALLVLSNMKDLYIRPSIMTYNSLLHNLRHTDIMWDVYSDIEANGICPTEYTNSIFLDGLCRQSLIHEAIAFLREIEEKQAEPCVVWFNTLMSGFCRMGFVDIAKSFFCMMFKYGLIPDAYSYNTLIHGLCISGSLEEALDFTNDMVKQGLEPDEVTYNILAKGFRLLGMMDGTWEVTERMLHREPNPDLLTYTILICGHCQTGNVEEGFRLREEMLSKGFQLNVISYRVLLGSLCKSGRINEALSLLSEVGEAEELYKQLLGKGIAPTIITFNSLINGSCKAGKLADARKWLDGIKMHNLVPSVVTYTTLMNAFCEAGNLEATVELLEEMEASGLEPNQVTYSVVMKGLCKQGKLEESVAVLKGMLAKGLSPDQASYNALIQCFCEARDLNRAFQLHDEMIKLNIHPNHGTYTILIHGQFPGLCRYQADRFLSHYSFLPLMPYQVQDLQVHDIAAAQSSISEPQNCNTSNMYDDHASLLM
ncbi:UNVERIFIED_CONTAM: hypothetical protein Sradi_6733000 [Sesamum radiatum]|uniref:Pentatricopeptide repeat-containing protein n=1 Tax=Sesamum radiatum TaxID=300843 RepID=A0AAW2JQE9_SESRA